MPQDVEQEKVKVNAFLQTLRNLGPMRLVAIAVVGISLLGMLGFITTRVSTSPLALLYTELDQHDSAAIAQKLDALKIQYQVDSSGTLIRVPSNQVGKIRMMMAADGLPKGGSIGYEIFDQKESFGTTSFVQNINHLRAMEGELARTIGAMDPIQNARVHLVLPQRELFSHSTQTATASIFLKTRNGAVLSREQIASIQHLIAAAVPQLQPGQVSIVDDRGNLLARPANSSEAGGGTTDQDDMRAQFEQKQARKIEDLLTQTLGYGKVRAQVSADLDFDRITTSSEIFDPDSQVVRSTQSVSEAATNSEGGANGGATIANNLPTAPQQIAGSGGGGTNNKNNRSEETINYEINKTVRNQVRESGQIRRISVAVVVDGAYKASEDGKTTTYVPRTEDEMKQIKELVKSAVNFDAARGDSLEVVNMPFAQSDMAKELEGSATNMLGGIPRADIFHAVETIILALIGLMVVLLIVRPILRKILESAATVSSEQALISGGAAYASVPEGMGNVAQLPSPGAQASNSAAEAEAAAQEAEIERMIDISRVEGRVKASSLRKVGEIVDKHPDEAIGILRNWMYQENR
ncbi:MAG: flagellar basal-body MS-ring/collar protein FliF [Alphaproteobacteria bacterium]|nr:flagellar basal-body MS-ring/collar protein FliF [Alphaproteobacteria bacterium]